MIGRPVSRARLGECVAEAVERSRLACRAGPRDPGPLHCGVEVTAQQAGGCEAASVFAFAGEDEGLAGRAGALCPPPVQMLDDFAGEVDASLQVVFSVLLARRR